MSRLVRISVVAALAAAVVAPSAASACTVTLEERKVGGPNWTAIVIVPVVTC